MSDPGNFTIFITEKLRKFNIGKCQLCLEVVNDLGQINFRRLLGRKGHCQEEWSIEGGYFSGMKRHQCNYRLEMQRINKGDVKAFI